MKERSLIMQGDMVRATLEGRKTQTRRPIKPQPDKIGERAFVWKKSAWTAQPPYCLIDGQAPVDFCPYGQPGNRLWVREAFASLDGEREIIYRADKDDGKLWKPSIHMPRWASRITLEIIRVWVERVQDISHKDLTAEGVEYMPFSGQTNHRNHKRFEHLTPQNHPYPLVQQQSLDIFADYWNSIYGPEAWERNDWVWCIEFKRI